jgi:hypothetical protein
LLSVVGEDDQSVGEEFLRLISAEKKRIMPAALGDKKTISELLNKIDYFLARIPENKWFIVNPYPMNIIEQADDAFSKHFRFFGDGSARF